MPTKKTLTIEELTKAREEAKNNFDILDKQLEEMKKEEADRKAAELALQKEERMAEIEAVQKHLQELYKAYIADYGYIKVETEADNCDWWPLFWKHNFWF